MRTKRAFSFLALMLLTMLLAACGGGVSTPAALLGVEAAQALPVSAEQLPAMPRGGDFNPLKITAALTLEQDGVAAYDHNAANVTLAGPEATYAPAANELAWAIYEFPGSAADEIGSVEYLTSNRNPGSIVYVAISNYVLDAWEFIGARDEDGAALVPPSSGEYASLNGYTYIAVLGFDGGGFDLETVKITYTNRYPVSGQVVDLAGAGVPDVTITTSLDGQSVMTDGAGEFTLPAIPDGLWHLMATKPGWTFYDNPQEISVSGGNLTGVEIVGYMNQSHFEPIEDFEPNDSISDAPNRDPSLPVEDYISAADDEYDYFRFVLDTPGHHWFRLETDSTVMFPSLYIRDKEGRGISSGWAYSGVVYVGLDVAATRVVFVAVRCQGGGGHYTLTSGLGPTSEVRGNILSGPGPEVMGYIKVELDNGSDQTYVLSSSGLGLFYTYFMPAVLTTVTPDPDDEDIFTYAPVFSDEDLSTGDKLNVDFSASGLLPLDFYEPNDTDVTAHDFGSLPVTSHDAVRVGDGDYEDWYRFAPAVDNYLIVRIDYDFNKEKNAAPVTAKLYDSTSTYMTKSYNTDTGVELRSEGPCDGNDYFIQVISSSDTTISYEMTIEEYSGYEVQFGARWDGSGLMNARFNLRSDDYGWSRSWETSGNGLTEIPFMFRDGETVMAELFRFGLDIDRQTRLITIDGANQTVWFDCDPAASADKWEPNTRGGIEVELPFATDATISDGTDPADKYIFSTTSTNPVRVVFSSPLESEIYDCYLWNIDPEPDEETDAFSFSGSADFLLVTDGPAPIQHMLEIETNSEVDTAYHLEIEEVAGYMLSGEVTDNAMMAVPNAYVFCPALNEVWYSPHVAPESSYELGPFLPGSYQIYIYAANMDSMPGSPWTLNVGASDVVQDFELTDNVTDVGEPNDTWGTAMFLASGVPVTANADSGTDEKDYYTFTVAGPQLINANIIFEKWLGNPTLTLFDTDGTTMLEYENSYRVGYQRIDYYLPAAGTYYLMARCGSGANDYDITVTY